MPCPMRTLRPLPPLPLPDFKPCCVPDCERDAREGSSTCAAHWSVVLRADNGPGRECFIRCSTVDCPKYVAVIFGDGSREEAEREALCPSCVSKLFER